MNKIYLYLLASVFTYVFSACNDELGTMTPPTFTTVEFESSTVYIPEEVPLAEIMLLVSNPSKEDIEVSISVTDETAIQGVHFELPNTSITIPKGAYSANVPITVFDDLEVTSRRRFKLNIASVSGADTSLITQQMTVYIDNNDKYPTIKFLETDYEVSEKAAGVYVKYMTEGIFPNPVVFSIRFAKGPAIAGVHYDYPAIVSPVDSINKANNEVFFTASTAKVDSVFIPLKTATNELRDGDKSVRLAFWADVNDLLPGGIKITDITIKDIKTVRYTESVLMIRELEDGSSEVSMPIEFNEIPQEGVTATINVEGLSSSDYTWENQIITVDKDTTVNAVLSINSGIDVPESLEFSITGDVNIDIDTRNILAKKAVVLPKNRWVIESVTSEHDETTVAENLIDGNMESDWHSIFGANGGSLPQEVVIDMRTEVVINYVTVYNRTDSKNAKIVEVSFSSDPSSNIWSEPLKIDLTEKESETAYLDKLVQGRFMKIYVNESTNGLSVGLAEVDVVGVSVLQ